MPTVTSHNREEWILREMARRAGKKYEPEGKKNMYASMSADEMKEHETMLKEAREGLKSDKE